MEIEIKAQAAAAEHVAVGEELLSFLEDWYTWATTTPDGRGHDYFAPYTGLCFALNDWVIHKCIDLDLEEELQDAFRLCGLDKDYPFGVENYTIRHHEDTQYLCPIRLEWVKKTIEKTKTMGQI